MQECQSTADGNAGALELKSRYLYMCKNVKMGKVELRRLRESSAEGVRELKSPTSWVLKVVKMRELKLRKPIRRDTDECRMAKRDST